MLADLGGVNVGVVISDVDDDVEMGAGTDADEVGASGVAVVLGASGVTSIGMAVSSGLLFPQAASAVRHTAAHMNVRKENLMIGD